jgi:hypothetical protein
MRKLLPSIFLSMIVLAQVAWAQEDIAPTTTAESQEVMRGVYDKSFRVTPRVGVLGYQDGSQQYTSRILGGFTADVNLAGLVPTPENWNFGLESGLLYSHTGSAGANFFGTDSPSNVTPGSNSFLVPIYLTMGYKPTDSFLIALNVGSNLVYRSIASSMIFGRGSDVGGSNQVDFFPSVGLNTGWSLSRAVALSLRGDYIPTPADDMFTATLGATFGIA